MSPLAYLVGCNFTCPEREREWNEWYNGPKLAQMLTKPLFLSGQRFEALDPSAPVRYLAVWRVESGEAFETPEYRSDWGFADYAKLIGDWTRDLVRLEGNDGPLSLACPMDAVLHEVRVNPTGPEQAQRAREAIDARCPGLTWGAPVGLDRSAAAIGLQVLTGGQEPQAARSDDLPVRQTLLRPLIPHTDA